MERLRKVVCGLVALIAVGVALVLGPVSARADEGSAANQAGGVVVNPAFQVGNAQGDGSGR